eukprot:TRINITY_DN48455_c0_g1_i1.p1 TRINITY_DN48455_c0_g1~~TRINITY_DN48455_c0_g1_i1.p1  ORF type:complete len:589 (-),score=79.49 TRINITY_DN48455_c0_g1_i1:63-1829(-)
MEVLTLQFGHFANHVGAHFWNFQDETAAVEEQNHYQQNGGFGGASGVDFERLHVRSDRRRGQVTWRPRLVVVDKRGALGGSAEVQTDADVANVAHDEAVSGLWDFGQETHHADRAWTHPFQRDLVIDEQAYESMEMETENDEGWDDDRDDREEGVIENGFSSSVKAASEYDFRSTVRTWTDFLKIKLPSGTVHELSGCHHGVAPFATFFDGLELRGSEQEDELLDLVRHQSEACDQLDAVHAIVDSGDGFGGVGDIVLGWVHDEHPKCGKLVVAVQPDITPQGNIAQCQVGETVAASLDTEACTWVSTAFSLAGVLNVGVEAWLPVAVPLWSVKGLPSIPSLCRCSLYEASAPIASALDTATLPYRLCGGLRPSGFLASIAPTRRPVCGLLHALPVPPPPPSQSSVSDKSDQNLSDCSSFYKSLFDLTATRPMPGNPFSSLVLRGDSPRRLVELTKALHPQSRRLCFTQETPLAIPLPFPQMFSLDVSARGVIGLAGSACARQSCVDVESCPVATQLHAAAHAGQPLALKKMAGTLKCHRRSAWGASVRAKYDVEIDDFQEVFESVIEHLECGAAESSNEEDVSDGGM